jgi:hypothetical protein
MPFPDTFRASIRKLLHEVTALATMRSVNEAVPEISRGLPRSDLSRTGTVYVSCDHAESVRQRGSGLAALNLITASNKTSFLQLG